MNQYQNIIGRSNPGAYSSIKGGYSSTAKTYPVPKGYQKRTPGKILKIKIWKLSKDFDDMIRQETNLIIGRQKNEPIAVSSRQAK